MTKKLVIVTDFIRYHLDIYVGIKDVVTSTVDLLGYQINKATNLEVTTIFDCLNIDKFMKLNDISNYSDWEKHLIWAYFSNNITPEAEKYLVDSLKDTIVIGYHLTNLISEILKRNNIPFIDTFETSYRYMQDSYLGFRSNISGAKDVLLKNSLSENTMYVYANYIKAFHKRKPMSELNENSCLLVGQTSKDSVLIKKDNTFVSLNEYKDKILEMSKKYHTLYYKMHPLEPLDNNIKELLLSIPNACEENRNFYELMAQDNIVEVFGLNSGAISEAKFFGKKTTFLFPKYHHYYQDGADINDDNTFIILNSNSHIVKINFWADLLSSIIPTYKVSEQEEVSFDNYQSLYSHYLDITSAYEFNIYSSYYINKRVIGTSWEISQIKERLNYQEEKITRQEEKINYQEFILRKNANRFKKLALNIFLFFIPIKSIRKSIRNRYIKN